MEAGKESKDVLSKIKKKTYNICLTMEKRNLGLFLMSYLMIKYGKEKKLSNF